MRKVAVTVSTPIIISQGDKDVVASVLGLQMNYVNFHEIFLNSTRFCNPADDIKDGGREEDRTCNTTCESDVSVNKT